jgi:hypothetical protein
VFVRGSERNGGDVVAVASVLPMAAARLAVFGLVWRVPIHVLVHDGVRGFVRATGQTTPSLRAWTTWDAIHLMPRSTWNDADEHATLARVTHELCHASLFHRRREERDARAHHAPRFVTEGVCSVVANQGSDRLPLADVLRRRDEDVDFEADAVFAYGYAHHVFARVAACRGPTALAAVVDATADGVAVEIALGADPERWLHGCPSDDSPGGDGPTR